MGAPEAGTSRVHRRRVGHGRRAGQEDAHLDHGPQGPRAEEGEPRGHQRRGGVASQDQGLVDEARREQLAGRDHLHQGHHRQPHGAEAQEPRRRLRPRPASLARGSTDEDQGRDEPAEDQRGGAGPRSGAGLKVGEVDRRWPVGPGGGELLYASRPGGEAHAEAVDEGEPGERCRWRRGQRRAKGPVP